MRGRSGDRVPADTQDRIATVAVTVVSNGSHVVLVAVVLDRDLEIWIGEVDPSDEAPRLVPDLVLGDGRRQAVSLEDAQHSSFSFALGHRRVAITEHLTEPTTSRSPASRQPIERRVQLRCGGQLPPEGVVESEVESPRAQALTHTLPDEGGEIEEGARGR